MVAADVLAQPPIRSRGFPLRSRASACCLASLYVVAVGCVDAGGVGEDFAEGEIRRGDAVESELRVCSWNVRKLGHSFDGLEKDYGAVAGVLDARCDVAVIVEVVQKGGLGSHPGFDRLTDELGSRWEASITAEPRPYTSSGHAEYYAFLWRRGAASMCPGWDRPQRLADGDGTDSSTGPDRFRREPAFTCFAAARDGGAMDFMLGAYHARWGSRDERMEEVAQLDDDLDGDGDRHDLVEAMREARPGEADLLVFGDFNLTTDYLGEALPDYTSLTVGTGSTINADDGITGNLYDHLVLPPDTHVPELVGPAQVLDVRAAAAPGDSFFQRVSDHLPIRARLDLRGPDDDEPMVGDGDGGGDEGGDGDDGYYAGIDPDLENEELAEALGSLLAGHRVVPGSELHDAFAYTDAASAGCDGLRDLYTGRCWDVAARCGSADAEGVCYSRVRVWPKSWWGGAEATAPYTDLVNARPLDGYAALRRSNAPLGEVDEARYVTDSGARVGECAHPEVSGSCLEPAPSARGDLARAYFYMAVRYRDSADCCTDDGVAGFYLRPWMEETLRSWHEADPVSADERARNDRVYEVQNNRNPFVDHPDWVASIGDF